MSNDHTVNDPRNIWQSQPEGPLVISPPQILRKAEDLRVRLRRSQAAFFLVFAGLSFVDHLVKLENRTVWFDVGRCAILAALLWRTDAWQAGLQGKKSIGLGLNSAATPGFDFYRDELLYQRDYFRHGDRLMRLGIFFGVIVLAPVIRAIVKPEAVFNLIPYGILLAVWAIGFAGQKRNELSRIQREIDALDAFRKDNPS